jgi:hypothetical protein
MTVQEYMTGSWGPSEAFVFLDRDRRQRHLSGGR